MAIEDELVTCPACAGNGTAGGERCDECRGRGIVRARPSDPPAAAAEPAPEEDEGDGLEGMTLVTLRELAEARGLSGAGSKDQLIKRLRKGQADPPAVEEDEAPADGLEKLTVAQLREKADELGVESGGRKAELLALIRGAIASGTEGEQGEGSSEAGTEAEQGEGSSGG